jgi:hypothetical protein
MVDKAPIPARTVPPEVPHRHTYAVVEVDDKTRRPILLICDGCDSSWAVGPGK